MCSERDSPLEPFVLPAPGQPELARLICGAHLGPPVLTRKQKHPRVNSLVCDREAAFCAAGPPEVLSRMSRPVTQAAERERELARARSQRLKQAVPSLPGESVSRGFADRGALEGYPSHYTSLLTWRGWEGQGVDIPHFFANEITADSCKNWRGIQLYSSLMGVHQGATSHWPDDCPWFDRCTWWENGMLTVGNTSTGSSKWFRKLVKWLWKTPLSFRVVVTKFKSIFTPLSSKSSHESPAPSSPAFAMIKYLGSSRFLQWHQF